jgi:dihydropteroate synthase
MHTSTWSIGNGASLSLEKPRIVGILNVTPDSFSDGGRFASPDDALRHAAQLVHDGADVIDVGGESTRPGAEPISALEELERVLPVIRGLARQHPDVPVSVDTTKSEVAAAALDEGASIVNDVSGFRIDPRLAQICATRQPGVVLMHSRGGVRDMASFTHATYDDVVADVLRELRDTVRAAELAGVETDRIVIDPGIGFAKRSEHSLAVLAALPRFVALGYPVLVGASRKRFVGEIMGVKEPSARVSGSIGAHVTALLFGARLFRVHDVRETRQALDVAWAVLRHGEGVTA